MIHDDVCYVQYQGSMMYQWSVSKRTFQKDIKVNVPA